MITFGYKTPWSGIVRALASLGLGILAVTYPGDVIPLLVKIFAVLLGLYGLGMLIFAFVNRDEKLFSLWLSIYQTIALISAERASRFGLWFFVLPVVETIAGGTLMFASQLFTSGVGIIVGIALIISGLSELFSSIKVYRIQKMMADAAKTEEQTDATVVTVDETKEDKPQA